MQSNALPRDPTLDELVDRLAIDDLLTRYTIAVDDENFELLDTVFTPDAILDYTSAGGPRGPYPEVREWLRKALAASGPARQHLIANKLVTLDGDTATVRAYFFNPNTMARPEDSSFSSAFNGPYLYSLGGGYYNHKLKRTPDGWRSIELFELRVWRQGYPPRPHPHSARSAEEWNFGAPPRPRKI
jgi:hypothetical protein